MVASWGLYLPMAAGRCQLQNSYEVNAGSPGYVVKIVSKEKRFERHRDKHRMRIVGLY